jgi:hypothetical protein
MTSSASFFRLAEVISLTVQAVLGDLIPMGQSYNKAILVTFVADRCRGEKKTAARGFSRRLVEEIGHDIDREVEAQSQPKEEQAYRLIRRLDSLGERVVTLVSKARHLIASFELAKDICRQ